MVLKYKFNLKDISLEDFKVYFLALFKSILPKKKIKNLSDLEIFIQKNQHGSLKLHFIAILKQEWELNMFFTLIMRNYYHR